MNYRPLKTVILEQCRGVHCVDLGESFHTHIYLQNLASIQPRTSPLKFAASQTALPERYPLARSSTKVRVVNIGGCNEHTYLPLYICKKTEVKYLVSELANVNRISSNVFGSLKSHDHIVHVQGRLKHAGPSREPSENNQLPDDFVTT